MYYVFEILIGDWMMTCIYALHMRLKQIEVWRKKTFWYQMLSVTASMVGHCWRGPEWSCWYQCRWYDEVHIHGGDMALEREVQMVSNYLSSVMQ